MVKEVSESVIKGLKTMAAEITKTIRSILLDETAKATRQENILVLPSVASR